MKYVTFSFIIICGILITDCGSKSAPEKPVQTAASELSAFELENGIGPIKEKLKLLAIDKAKAKQGERLFTEKCSACHKLDERYVGPAQRDVIKRRTPEYIVNMILNPQGMIEKHPDAKKMLAQYMTPMAYQNVSVGEALTILEYFRVVAEEIK